MEENELVRKVFNMQKLSSCKTDWVVQLNADLKLCDISLSEEEVRNMKKYAFSVLVNKKVRHAAINHIILLRNKHSKSEKLSPSNGLKEYLKCCQLSIEEQRLLFSMKCRMSDLKVNYQNKHRNDLSCALCREDIMESESHLLQCKDLVGEESLVDEIGNIKPEDIYGNLKDQICAIKLWKKLFKVRRWKLETRKLSCGHQAHQPSASDGCDDSLGVDTVQNSLLGLFDSGYQYIY